MLQNFSIIGIFFLGGLAFTLIALAANWLVRPKKPHKEKETTYECGPDTQGSTWIQFKINYFLYALIFVAFDIETVFLYPWAVVFKSVGMFAFIEMFVFISILALGLWYAWKKGALEWK
ncbi:MAG: NADH-quinone oxidoreductase subunit A [Actinobacteria bacterium]|nr:NADH-quinone oxidoreductase subunit A [Actinomycetota bacterium]